MKEPKTQRRQGMSASRASMRVGRKFRHGLDEHGISVSEMNRRASEALKKRGLLGRRKSHHEAMLDATFTNQARAAVGYD